VLVEDISVVVEVVMGDITELVVTEVVKVVL
jgi:hypothetical protein